MRKKLSYLKFLLVALMSLCASAQTTTFDYMPSSNPSLAPFKAYGQIQSYMIPAGVSTVTITAAGGTSTYNNNAAIVKATYEVTPGMYLNILVAGRGGEACGGGGTFVTYESVNRNGTSDFSAASNVDKLILAAGGAGSSTAASATLAPNPSSLTANNGGGNFGGIAGGNGGASTDTHPALPGTKYAGYGGGGAYGFSNGGSGGGGFGGSAGSGTPFSTYGGGGGFSGGTGFAGGTSWISNASLGVIAGTQVGTVSTTNTAGDGYVIIQVVSVSGTILAQIGTDADDTATTTTITVAQLGLITPAITGIVAENQAAYQAYIDANPNLFSSPATAAEVQAMVTTVNAQVAGADASNAVLAQIGTEGDSPNTVSSEVSIAQLGQILPALSGIIPSHQADYQAYIDANPNLFGAPATAAEVQAMVNAVNLMVTTIFYVDSSKPDNSGDGLSWATAKKDLQVILDNYANNPGPNVNEVWIKTGDYTPTAFVGTTEAARDKSFWVKGNIKIYGGFNGTETALNQRNIVTNPTVLLGGGAYHTMIITNTNTTSYTLIDGLTIKDGNANGSTTNPVGTFNFERNFGGGVLCYQTAPVFNNVIFKANSAEYGGGVFNQTASPKFNNCVFTGNTSTSYGGAIENFSNANPVFSNCIISNNSALRGGAAANNGGTATYINCTIVKNNASVATAGGAFHNLNATTCTSENCIIWGNTASDFLTEAGSTLNVSYSVTQTTVSGASNVTTDPQLVDSNDGDGLDNQWLTNDDGFRINPSSNCVNSGDATALPSYITADILNNTRIEAGAVDRGAYEVSATTLSDAVLTQIGTEGDEPNNTVSEVTTAQLGLILPAITGIVAANGSGYQAYIDANPDLFSTPATAAEVQAMVTAVNTVIAASNTVLTQIGNEGDTPNIVPSVVTTAQLGQILLLTEEIIEANQAGYQAYIDAYPNLFSSPATPSEIDIMLYEVNYSSEILTQIGNEADAPNTVLSTVTTAQLESIFPVITDIVAANEEAYQAYIDAHPDLFSAPATAAEVQAMVTAVNLALSIPDLNRAIITIYPNPSKAVFNIKIEENASFELYDITGKRLVLDEITMGTTELNLSNCSDGVYFLKITNERNQTKTVRLIKE